MSKSSRQKSSNSRVQTIVIVLLTFGLIATSVSTFIFWKQASKNEGEIGLSNGLQEIENTVDADASLLEEIGKLIVLPTDETPTIGTISDPAVLRDQPFFKNAKKGDRLIIYSKSNKAILFDPIAHKIIEVAPLSLTGDPKL